MPEPEWGHQGRWRRGHWGEGERPPWWPEGEAWPPQGQEGWRRLRRRFIGRAVIFAVVALTILAGLAALLVWALATLFGTGSGTVVAAVVVLLALLLVGRAVVRGVRGSAEPIADLMAAASRVETGDYGARVQEAGPRDLRRLARAFNAMSAHLERDAAERRQLLADVSHELRTPLSVIQGNVEGILDGLYPADRAHLEPILEETQLLERLVEDLRTLSLSETGALRLHREPTDLAELLAESVAAFRAKADAASVALSSSVDDDLPVLELDQSRLRQVIGNLLDNAVRLTPPGGSVKVHCATAGAAVLIEVQDTGPGIAADVLPRIFDRFYRSGERGGSGLGLPIARSLVEAHGGTISAASEPGHGTTISIRLPAGEHSAPTP
ncbi:MAG TPA: HAMP domain-containing sensor histidine kinase [Candidatus Limnocylindria bacterium]|nr:HAMP domain-containing sensor histidine kinase [Candidatus Limnocylindria bacterium]